MTPKVFLSISLLLASLVALTGCVSTTIEREALPPEVFELAAVNSKRIGLRVVQDEIDNVVGHQFLLFFLPFGRVSIADPVKSVHRALYEELSIRGYKPIPVSNELQSSTDTLFVRLKSIQASAYDFLFFRRVFSRIEISGSIVSENGESLPQVNALSNVGLTKRFGFEKELNEVLQLALLESSRELLDKLRVRERIK